MLGSQRALLAQLMSDPVAARILDSVGKADKPSQAFQLSELYHRLTQEVWSESATATSPTPRRDLQREFVNRVAAVLLHPASLDPRRCAQPAARRGERPAGAHRSRALSTAAASTPNRARTCRTAPRRCASRCPAKLQRAGA